MFVGARELLLRRRVTRHERVHLLLLSSSLLVQRMRSSSIVCLFLFMFYFLLFVSSLVSFALTLSSPPSSADLSLLFHIYLLLLFFELRDAIDVPYSVLFSSFPHARTPALDDILLFLLPPLLLSLFLFLCSLPSLFTPFVTTVLACISVLLRMCVCVCLFVDRNALLLLSECYAESLG